MQGKRLQGHMSHCLQLGRLTDPQRLAKGPTMTGYVATQPRRLAQARAFPSGSPLWWAWGTFTRLPLLLKDQA